MNAICPSPLIEGIDNTAEVSQSMAPNLRPDGRSGAGLPSRAISWRLSVDPLHRLVSLLGSTPSPAREATNATLPESVIERPQKLSKTVPSDSPGAGEPSRATSESCESVSNQIP